MRRKVVTARERNAIVESLRRHLENRPEILCAYLHGSFSTEEPYRDIDVAVWIDPARLDLGATTRYALDLSTELSLALGEAVDVQVLNRAPLTFRHHAFKGQPLVVRDREWLDELRARTWDDYSDFLPFARQYLRELLGA
ncbi:MAG: nucleotidyltransferase domain-containing protein [Candidatus Rokuibacteriota bacterium]